MLCEKVRMHKQACFWAIYRSHEHWSGGVTGDNDHDKVSYMVSFSPLMFHISTYIP